MSERLARIAPEEMTTEQSEIYELFIGGKRAAPGSAFSLAHPDGGLVGPPNAWLLSPPLARVFEQAGGAMRFSLQLSDRSREIALLLHAFSRDCAFELHAHRLAGRAAGLADDEIEALATRTAPTFQSDEEAAVFAATLPLLDRKALDDTEYAAAVAVLGDRKLFELVSLVGYYDMIATQLNVYRVAAPAT